MVTSRASSSSAVKAEALAACRMIPTWTPVGLLPAPGQHHATPPSSPSSPCRGAHPCASLPSTVRALQAGRWCSPKAVVCAGRDLPDQVPHPGQCACSKVSIPAVPDIPPEARHSLPYTQRQGKIHHCAVQIPRAAGLYANATVPPPVPDEATTTSRHGTPTPRLPHRPSPALIEAASPAGGVRPATP